MNLVSLIADWLMIPLVGVALYGLVFGVKNARRYEAYLRIILAGLTSYILAKFAALIYQPNEARPFEILGVDPGAAYLNNPGFPSDHALFAVFLALAVCFVVKNRTMAIIVAVLALVVCVGRVLALVHTPLDVLGGAIIACLGAVWYLVPFKIKQISSKKRKNVVK